MHRKHALLLSIALVLAEAPLLAAAMETDPPPPPVTAEHAAGKRAIDAKDWGAAIKALTAAVQREERNPEIHNLLGYAFRNNGQLELALKHYHRALELDARHLGAHEYIGEAYLMMNNVAKAEEHLAALTRICPWACEQRDDLKRKIDDYRARSR